MGVLGAVGHTPETLEVDLTWIDEQMQGKPYGIDLLITNNMDSKSAAISFADLEARVPVGRRENIEDFLAKNGLDTTNLWSRDVGNNMRVSGASGVMDFAFRHPIKIIVNALGVPPDAMFECARPHGALVGALTGSKEHAFTQHGAFAQPNG